MKLAMKWAGADVPSANRITLLRDADGDGVAEIESTFLAGLNSPFGMALVGSDLYVANTDAVSALPLSRRARPRSTRQAVKVADLPAGTLNHHWTKNIIASRDGAQLYAAVGSNSNVGENGMDKEDRPRRDLSRSISRPGSRASSPRACAIRTAWPGSRDSGELWVAVNERDEIGSDLVPDYMTSVTDGGFYGWPYSYYGQHVDRAGPAAAAGSRRQGDRARLRARAAHRFARPGLLRRHAAAGARIAAAPSSASTAHGTASRPAATR